LSNQLLHVFQIDLLSLKVPVPCHSILLQPLAKPDNMAALIQAR